MSWVKDQLVYWVDDPKTRGDIWSVPMTGEHKAVAVLATSSDELFPQLSPDGKWIAYQAPDSMNAMQVWVNSFPKGQNSAWQITNEGGLWPRWRGDGKSLELYFVITAPSRPSRFALRVRRFSRAYPATLRHREPEPD
jgi:Tol biopolymer transport system component